MLDTGSQTAFGIPNDQAQRSAAAANLDYLAVPPHHGNWSNADNKFSELFPTPSSLEP